MDYDFLVSTEQALVLFTPIMQCGLDSTIPNISKCALGVCFPKFSKYRFNKVVGPI